VTQKKVFTLLIALIVISLLTACGGSQGDKSITIGSKDFAEQYIVAEMYAQVLEQDGFTVARKFGLAGTPVAQAALLAGEIDLYPEYTGTGLLTVLKEPVNSDPQAVYQTVQEGYKQFGLVWLDPAPMNNTQALAVPRSLAEEGITTISDMVAHASELVMVGPAEFVEREDGLPGIKANYGDFELADYKAVDKGLRYQAVADGQAQVVVAFGTDGELAAFDMVVLQDDKGMFPPYQIAPVITQTMLDAHPEIADLLNPVTALLTNETMQALNYEVTGNGREPADVATEFLTENGFLQ
jgi:osmoprotectant transport system substrate-binding protein